MVHRPKNDQVSFPELFLIFQKIHENWNELWRKSVPRVEANEKRKKEASSKQFNEFVSEGYKL